MGSWVLHAQKIKFIHIPKNAGSAISKWAKNQFPIVRVGPATHHSLIESNELLPETKDYFSFCVIRNTYDRMVSLYEFTAIKAEKTFRRLEKRKNRGKTKVDAEKIRKRWETILEYYNLGFNKWLDTPICLDHPGQLSYIFDEEGQQISYIVKYENFDNDIQIIKDRLGTDTPIKIANARENPKPYQEYYDDETREKVYHMYKSEIDYFNFKF